MYSFAKTPNLKIATSIIFILTTISCSGPIKQHSDQNSETKKVSAFQAYLIESDTARNHLTDKYKAVRQDALKKINQNEVYKSLVLQKIVDQNYLIVLETIGSSIISEHNDQFEITLERENELKKIPGALQFLVNVIRLEMYGGVPDEILSVYQRYVDAYRTSGTKGSIIYNANTNSQTTIINDFTLVETLAVFKFNYPTILDEFYNEIQSGKKSWKDVTGAQYRYAYLRDKESFNNYLATNYPESPNYVHYDIVTSAADLYDAYDANEVSADEKYKSKLIKVTGRIQSISKDIFDNPYVSITAGDFAVVQCLFKDPKQLSSLSKGDRISIVGVCTGKMSISVGLSDCKIF